MAVSAAFMILLTLIAVIHFISIPASTFADPKNGIIVIDAGHGGIDAGTNKDGILEKEINLAIAQKLKVIMEQKGYTVVMSREEDISLDSLDHTSQSRHKRDLNARVSIINHSNAQLFISIHVNCNFKRPSTDGAIVFYGNEFRQSETLAYCIQRALNGMIVNGKKRTTHDPQQAKFYILSHSQVPGVIVETAFLSNAEEKKLLINDEFREQLALSIADGADQYLNDQ
jgi:N-acetylmuramoyl-L-alanine amidase